MGVFATRSPYRPNELGLSSVKIEKIDLKTDKGPVIYVSGADLLDGTPIFDIKPYLPFTDSHPQAKAGFAQDHLTDQLAVSFDCDTEGIEEKDIRDLKEILSQDPRPHYQEDKDRVYKMDLLGYHLDFVVEDWVLKVKEIH